MPQDSTSWTETLRDLKQRHRVAKEMGGPERLSRHRSTGRLDARERVDRLLDDGSFREIGILAGPDGIASDGLVAGWGEIDGAPVMVGAEDFTTLAGTIGAASNAKRHRLAELALSQRCPLVMLLEGAGFRPEPGPSGRAPTDLLAQVRCSGRVPIVAAVMGASAGHGALVVPLADFSVMTPTASVFTAGPPVVAESTGEEIDKHALGGPEVAIPSGLIHNLAADEDDAFEQIRRFLDHLPPSAWSYPAFDPSDPVATSPREVPEVLSIIPRDSRRSYDMRSVIERLVDDGDTFEIQAGFGTSILCLLSRIGGFRCAIVANQPSVAAGAIDVDAADKAARFIAMADAFHLPLVFLSDNPGMLPGSASEQRGILRAGARMFAAQSRASTAKIHLTLRKAYGFGSMVMGMAAHDGQVATYAFPGATLGAMSAAATGTASGADEDRAAALRDAELMASYKSASSLGFDDLIHPAGTRNVLIDALALAEHRNQHPAEPVSHPATII